MSNSWTGGQYSVFRLLFGAYLFVHFSYLAFWAAELFSSEGMLSDASLSPLIHAFPNILAIIDHPGVVVGLSIISAVAALAFAVGYGDRIAALIMWFALACFLGRNPLITNPSLPYAGWMLLAHLFIPTAPFGSVKAMGRADPRGAWIFPPGIFLAAWLVLALSYSYSGYTKLLSPSWVAGENVQYVLTNPLARDWFLREIFMAVPPIFLTLLTWFILAVEILFAPLALLGRLRPWLWSAMLFVQLGFALLLNFPDLTIAMLLFHLFTFDPAWLPARSLEGTNVFYDGNCALCHGSIRFLLAEEPAGELHFAALQGDLFKRTLTDQERAGLSDTFVAVLPDGTVLTEAEGAIYLLDALGGVWRIIASAMKVFPRPARRWGYHFIGDRRYRIFGTKNDMCPLASPEIRSRFLD
jgi:predicted DCC family thiol-disulfide oxidoreductase YuxK